MPPTTPAAAMPISSTAKTSIFAVIITTDNIKLRAVSRGLNIEYFKLFSSV